MKDAFNLVKISCRFSSVEDADAEDDDVWIGEMVVAVAVVAADAVVVEVVAVVAVTRYNGSGSEKIMLIRSPAATCFCSTKFLISPTFWST